jgi:hypothetical protein
LGALTLTHKLHVKVKPKWKVESARKPFQGWVLQGQHIVPWRVLLRSAVPLLSPEFPWNFKDLSHQPTIFLQSLSLLYSTSYFSDLSVMRWTVIL